MAHPQTSSSTSINNLCKSWTASREQAASLLTRLRFFWIIRETGENLEVLTLVIIETSSSRSRGGSSKPITQILMKLDQFKTLQISSSSFSSRMRLLAVTTLQIQISLYSHKRCSTAESFKIPFLRITKPKRRLIKGKLTCDWPVAIIVFRHLASKQIRTLQNQTEFIRHTMLNWSTRAQCASQTHQRSQYRPRRQTTTTTVWFHRTSAATTPAVQGPTSIV